ncbi:hypothetical protein GCM10009096_19550 [Parasphingorhabdus litoris]|uniref:DUF1826 domain-containing protein n=1 Tax=Parasphingorhabdus litoris TaxID=394733 RepID=A0ABN1AIZ8_9SPHN|nr:DUF1826 domain-containing protein [Parasphingorhabdus litoris]
MNDLIVSSPSETAKQIVGCEPAVLQRILDKSCNLAVWKRSKTIDCSSLLNIDLENVRVRVPSGNPEKLLQRELDRCGFPKSVARACLAEDIMDLCQLFGEMIPHPKIEVRIELVTGNSCWKFHSDYVEMRLITTYIGRGTQWVDQNDTDRIADGLEPLHINELEPGDVGLFKGKLKTNQPVIHRSPPIEGTGEKRLLLVLNPAEG